MYHNSLELGIRTYTLEKRGYVANIFGNFFILISCLYPLHTVDCNIDMINDG